MNKPTHYSDSSKSIDLLVSFKSKTISSPEKLMIDNSNLLQHNKKNKIFLYEKPEFSKEEKKIFQEAFKINNYSAEKIFEEIFYELNYKLSRAFFIMKFKVLFQ